MKASQVMPGLEGVQFLVCESVALGSHIYQTEASMRLNLTAVLFAWSESAMQSTWRL